MSRARIAALAEQHNNAKVDLMKATARYQVAVNQTRGALIREIAHEYGITFHDVVLGERECDYSPADVCVYNLDAADMGDCIFCHRKAQRE